MTYPSVYAPIPVPDLENWNTDRSVDVPVMVRGTMYRTSAGEWYYGSGRVYSDDASLLRVSTVGGAVGSSSPLSADSSNVSAKQENASNLRVSCVGNDGFNLPYFDNQMIVEVDANNTSIHYRVSTTIVATKTITVDSVSTYIYLA